MSKKISIGSDHAGFELKEKVKEHLKSKGFQVLEKGCFSPDRADYPDYGHAVALSVTHKESELGILLCGSGVGISISANKHKGIRAALCWNPEIAKLSRQHNDANVLVFPARFISAEAAFECADIFISEQFEGGRHQARVDKIEI